MPRNRLIVLLFCLMSCLTFAARAEKGATRLTDPEQLTRLGFPADARNVYLAEGVVLGQSAVASAPEEFGTADTGWTTVVGNQHHGRTSSEYDTAEGGGDVYLISGTAFLDAQLQMPNGASWEAVRWWAVDDAPAGDLSFILFRVCQTSGAPTTLLLGNASSGPLSGEFSFTLGVTGTPTVDNASCAYVARTRMSFNSDVWLRKIRAQWRRQVSVAPLVATFPNDTPTSHPFFRFIEALAAASITAGCAPGSFCPDNPITRGEMAVFLSAALGLHFP